MGFSERGVWFILVRITKPRIKDQSPSFSDMERKLLKSVNYFRNAGFSISLKRGFLVECFFFCCFVVFGGVFYCLRSPNAREIISLFLAKDASLAENSDLSPPKRKHLDLRIYFPLVYGKLPKLLAIFKKFLEFYILG